MLPAAQAPASRALEEAAAHQPQFEQHRRPHGLQAPVSHAYIFKSSDGWKKNNGMRGKRCSSFKLGGNWHVCSVVGPGLGGRRRFHLGCTRRLKL
jgi:hypothetical protein